MPKFMNLKKLTEQRAKKQTKMQDLVDAADAEERSLNEAEIAEFEKLEKEVLGIDASIRAVNAARNLDDDIPAGDDDEKEKKKPGKGKTGHELMRCLGEHNERK